MKEIRDILGSITPQQTSPNSNQAQASGKADDVKQAWAITSKEAEEKGYRWKKAPPEPKNCKFCGSLIYHEGIPFGDKEILMWSPQPQRCTCEKATAYWKKHDAEQEQKRIEEERSKERALMNERIEKLLGKSGIKKRFATRTFENFRINQENRHAYEVARRYADEFQRYAEEGKGLYFEGTYGTGKTHLAVAIALTLINQGVPVICKTSIDILADIKKSYDEKTQYGEHQVMDLYKKADLLVIDDLGKEQCTDWSMPNLYAILNDRYENMKPTIITTNYNEEMLINRLTPKNGDSSNIEAIISRLHECNEVVTMAWADYRGGGYE